MIYSRGFHVPDWLNRRTWLAGVLVTLAALAGAMSADAQSSTLSVSDFDQSGLETVVLASFDAGGDTTLYSAPDSRWGAAGSLVEGDVDIDDVTRIVRVMLPNSDGSLLRLNDNGGLVLRDFFGQTGAGADLTVWMQTSAGTASFAASGVRSAGSNYVNFNVPASERAVLTGIGTGDRFLLALTRPAPNTPATGDPTITGTAQVGQTLTADTSAITDAEGLDNVAYTYQWLADDTGITGATASAYTLTEAEEGKAIRVKVSFNDDEGNEEQLTSAETAAVAAAPNTPATGAPTITGTVQVGQTLTAGTSDISDAEGLDNVAYTYQWLADDTGITGATASAYTLTEAEEGKAIKVRVSFSDDEGNAEERTSSATVAVAAAATTTPEPTPTPEPFRPGGVTRFTLTSPEPGQLVAAWTAPQADHADDYRVSWAKQDQDWPSWRDEDRNAHPTTTTHTINGLDHGTDYKVRVRARLEQNTSSPWSGPWTETATQRVKDHPPAAPTGLTASQVSHNSLTLSWDVPQDTGITGYRILRGDDAASLSSMEMDTGNNSTEYTDATVEPETTYRYVILALSPDGDGDQSGAVSATTPAAPQPAEQPVQNDPPGAPTGLTASSIEHDSLTLAWDDPQDDSITAYQVLRGAGEDTLSTLEPDTGNAGTEYTDSTLAAETTYFYAVTALSADGDSAQSGAMSVTTLAEPQPGEEPIQNDPPEAPTGLAASETSHDSLTLTWNGPKDDSVTGYRILRGTAPKNLPTIKEDTKSSSPKYTDKSVGEATAYFYQAVALRDDAESPKSITIEVATPASSVRSVPRQSTTPSTQTLVSNTDRATPHMEHLIARDLAQGFRTGPHATGYRLSTVDLYATGAGGLTVRLVEGSAGNQQTAAHLTPPAGTLIGHAVYSFSAPPNTTLEPNKDYWIVVNGNGNGWFKATPGDDAAPVPGWKLADTYDYRSKYLYAADGAQSINTSTAFRQFTGNLSIRINRLNNQSTGEPAVGGLAYAGEPLTALITGISDRDGLADPFASLIHQWKRHSADGVTFEANVGTNSRTYTLTPADEGKTIRVTVHFVDNAGNGEGPIESAVHPPRGTVGPAAPPSLNLVSNTSQNGNSDNQFSNQAHAQAFTTGSERNGYILSKVTIISEDEEEDDIALSVCEVDGNTHPTETCTDLIPPTLFEMGSLVFSAPRDRPVTLKPGTTYSVVFNSPGGQDVKLDATDGDGEDTSSLGGWSIRNRSQLQSNNQWADRGYDRAMLIAITGRLSPNEAPEGIPAITGIHAAGQTLTASTESITDPDGVPTGLTYQWKRYASDNVFEDDIGANLPTHTLTAADEGKKIRVEVSYIDNQGYIEGPLASPLSAVIGAAPLISNTSQTGRSTTPVSTPLAQAFTTGSETHGYTISRVTIFYEDEDRQPLDLRICGASGDGIPNQECVTLSRPTTFSPGALNYTPPKGETIQLDGNTTHVVQLEWPNAALEPPPMTEQPPNVGVTTSNGEDPLTSSGWSMRNAFTENDPSWRDASSGASMRMAIHGAVTKNSEAAGAPAITGTARTGYTLTALPGGIIDANGIPDTFTYQWKRHSAEGDFEAGIGANSNQYTITPSDQGKKIKVEVSFTDRSNYSEGPLASEIYPPGTTVIVSVEDDLLVSNTGQPEQQTVQITADRSQNFRTGNNPNGYEITGISIASGAVHGETVTIRLCELESQNTPTVSSNCRHHPTPDNPVRVIRRTSYAIMLQRLSGQVTVDAAVINREDPTSLPDWSIGDKHQLKNSQNTWEDATDGQAIRIEIRGRPRSAMTNLGRPTATPGNGQVSVDWQFWTPTLEEAAQNFQYRVMRTGEPWDPNWTDIPGSDANTETHTLSNLTNGVEHTVEIRAVFVQDGQTVLGGAETLRATPRAPLTAPGNLDANTEGDRGVRLSWSDPADSTLTGYQHRYRNTSDDGWNPDWTNIPGSGAATTSHILTGMAKDLLHTLEVRTLRGTEQGPAASSSVIPRGALPYLHNLTAAADDQQAALSWDNPGDHSITGYQYRHQAAIETGWNPNWTSVPGSNAGTTSHTVRSLVNLTAYTFEVRAVRGLEEGQASSTAATTPDGPAAVPREPRNLVTRERDQGFTASWGTPPEADERAPVTSYLVRHRQTGTSPWQNVTVMSDDCCATTITGLTNRRHYEVQAAAVNRIGAGPWAGPVNVTPQAPATQPPAPTGDADLSLGTLSPYWTTTGSDHDPGDSCTGPKSFYIIWGGPDGHEKRADEWAAHINTHGGAGEVTHNFRESPGSTGHYEMYGTVNFQGPGRLSINIRGRFGPTWGTWSRPGDLYCFE